jgi:hypothetical protein
MMRDCLRTTELEIARATSRAGDERLTEELGEPGPVTAGVLALRSKTDLM